MSAWKLSARAPMISPWLVRSTSAATQALNGGSQARPRSRPSTSQATRPTRRLPISTMGPDLDDDLGLRGERRVPVKEILPASEPAVPTSGLQAARLGGNLDLDPPELIPEMFAQALKLQGRGDRTVARPAERDLDVFLD